MATEKEHMSTDWSKPTGTTRGPAAYFPSIERTYGRPISDWKAIIRAHTDLTHLELVKLLKTDHGLGHGHANALVAHTLHESAKR